MTSSNQVQCCSIQIFFRDSAENRWLYTGIEYTMKITYDPDATLYLLLSQSDSSKEAHIKNYYNSYLPVLLTLFNNFFGVQKMNINWAFH